jgi:hypothetical protein
MSEQNFFSKLNLRKIWRKCPSLAREGNNRCTFGNKCHYIHPERENNLTNEVKLEIILTCQRCQRNIEQSDLNANSQFSNPDIIPKDSHFCCFQNSDTGSCRHMCGFHGKLSRQKTATTSFNNFGIENFPINSSESYRSLSNINRCSYFDSQSINSFGQFIDENSSSNQLNQCPSKNVARDENDHNRTCLNGLVEQGYLNKEQVDRVLKENPNETGIDNLVFYASIDQCNL